MTRAVVLPHPDWLGFLIMAVCSSPKGEGKDVQTIMRYENDGLQYFLYSRTNLMPHSLTPRQHEYLEYLRSYIKENEASPRLDEIAKHFRVKPPTAHKTLEALHNKDTSTLPATVSQDSLYGFLNVLGVPRLLFVYRILRYLNE
jgi:hypothetical protein